MEAGLLRFWFLARSKAQTLLACAIPLLIVDPTVSSAPSSVEHNEHPHPTLPLSAASPLAALPNAALTPTRAVLDFLRIAADQT